MPSTEAGKPRVALFVTCLVDLFRPSVGFAAVKLLEPVSVFARWAASIRHEELAGGASRITYTYEFTARPRALRWVLEPILLVLFRRETSKRLVGGNEQRSRLNRELRILVSADETGLLMTLKGPLALRHRLDDEALHVELNAVADRLDAEPVPSQSVDRGGKSPGLYMRFWNHPSRRHRDHARRLKDAVVLHADGRHGVAHDQHLATGPFVELFGHVADQDVHRR